MSIPASFIDQVKARIRISDVISKRLRTERKGREFISVCPFHNDTKPSLTISDDKGFYHCFSCGAHGNVFDFLMNYEGLSFVESIERLARQVGMDVPKSSPKEAQYAAKRRNLHDVMELVCRYYEQQLWSPNGQKAIETLRNRGLEDETLKKFRLGFAPNIKGHLIGMLEKNSVNIQQLIDTGMLSVSEKGDNAPYSRFRDRIMFPIFDASGNPIAFGGRIMSGEGAKYLNSPETILFHKGDILYAHHLATLNARKKNQLIVGEGYMDVIAMHQAGFDTAVAPLGTALTEQQLGLLWRHVNQPTLCFDGDTAGQKAAWRALERSLPLLKPGFSLKFVTLPEGEDPDSIIQKQGAQALKNLLARSLNISEKIWQYLTEDKKLSSAEEAAEVDNEINRICFNVKDETMRHHLVNFLRQRLWKKLGMPPPNTNSSHSSNQMDKKYKYFTKDSRFKKKQAPVSNFEAKKTIVNAKKWHEKILLFTLVSHPDLFDDIEERLGWARFSSDNLNRLKQEVLKVLSHQPALDFKELTTHLKKVGYGDTLSQLALDHKNGLGAMHRFIRPSASTEIALEGWNDIWEKWWDIPREEAELKACVKLSSNDSDKELEKDFNNIREIKLRKWSRKSKND